MEIIYNIYQKLGDYFTGTHRRRKFSITIFVIYLLVISLSIYFRWSISLDTVNTFLSSVVTALFSLIALLGVAVFFKMEILRQEESVLIQSFNSLTFNYKKDLILSGEELSSYLDKHYKNNINEEILIIKRKLESTLLSKKIARNNIIPFTVYTFSVALLSLIFIAFAPIVTSFYLGFAVMFLVFLLTAYCAFLVVKTIADSVYH